MASGERAASGAQLLFGGSYLTKRDSTDPLERCQLQRASRAAGKWGQTSPAVRDAPATPHEV